MTDRRGFTLLELAIVLVIVGFLIAAVMNGAHLLPNARVQKTVADLQQCTQSFMLYYDRYGMYPGDENDASFPPSDTANGNHNGLIDASEAGNVWEDLAHSIGFVRPSCPIRGAAYTYGTRPFFGAANQNCIALSPLPNRDAQSIDARHDDGMFNTGNIHSSAAYDGSETLVMLYWRM